MRFAPFVLAVVLAGALAGCARPYYQAYSYDYGPTYAYAAPAAHYYYYPARYSYSYSPARYYTSKWDYYRNYQGSLHPGPEGYP